MACWIDFIVEVVRAECKGPAAAQHFTLISSQCFSDLLGSAPQSDRMSATGKLTELVARARAAFSSGQSGEYIRISNSSECLFVLETGGRAGRSVVRA